MYKRHLVIAFLVWVLILGLAGYWLNESNRREAAAANRLSVEVVRGAEVYAANCMSCHGPVGEGVVGLPLNVEAYRGDPHENEDVASFLAKTIQRGRPGQTGTVWEYRADGKIVSFSQMPSWSKEEEGPLTEEEIKDVVAFIMTGDWENAFYQSPEPTLQNDWPKVEGLPDNTIEQAQDLILEKGCLSCHRLSNKGGGIGPDLSNVGSWLERERLQQWLEDPQAVAPERRGPSIWSQGAEKELASAWMPKIPLEKQELELLLDYFEALR